MKGSIFNCEKYMKQFIIILLFLATFYSCTDKQPEQSHEPVSVETDPPVDENYQAALRQHIKEMKKMDVEAERARARAKENENRQTVQTSTQGSHINTDHDSRLMKQFDKLNEEGRRLVDEIGRYYRTGQAGPYTVQAVFRLKQIQDEKIQLAQQMGNRELETISRQQKVQTLTALRQMGF